MNGTNLPEITPCRCGRGVVAARPMSMGYFECVCTACKAGSESRPTVREAIQAWNTRKPVRRKPAKKQKGNQ